MESDILVWFCKTLFTTYDQDGAFFKVTTSKAKATYSLAEYFTERCLNKTLCVIVITHILIIVQRCFCKDAIGEVNFRHICTSF